MMPKYLIGATFTDYATKNECEIVGYRFIIDTYDDKQTVQYVWRTVVAGQEVINHEGSESRITRSLLK